MKSVGFFYEMNLYVNSGSIKDFLVDAVDYDKETVITYLKSYKMVAGCPKTAIDCVTGKEIAPSFCVYTDGEYEWCDFLIYHVKKYNVALPEEFVKKIMNVNEKTY